MENAGTEEIPYERGEIPATLENPSTEIPGVSTVIPMRSTDFHWFSKNGNGLEMPGRTVEMVWKNNGKLIFQEIPAGIRSIL